MKKCTKCGDSKELGEFSKKKSSKDGLRHCCKACDNERRILHSRTKIGLILEIYGSQRRSSKKRGHNPPAYTKQKFIDFTLASMKFHKLYDNWVASGYQKDLSPSFDRADDYKGYSFENFNDWMPWKTNKQKGCNDRKNGINNKGSKAIVGTHKITGNVVELYSAWEAQRQLGICQSDISKCCSKKKKKDSKGYYYTVKSVGGYIWEYAK